MDAIEILGSLLGGGKSSGQGGGGLGGKILTEMMRGGSRQPAPQAPTQSPSANRPQVSRPVDLQREASELEDLLNVARGRVDQRRGEQTSTASQSTPRTAPAPQVTAPRSNSPFQMPNSAPPPRRAPSPDYRNDQQAQNDDATILIRAMINAAKADGEVSQEEQQSILDRIGNPTQEVISFLRQEFNQPLNVRDFAWSVPLGLEHKVYSISLAAIDLDQNAEANYLRELAHGLRLTPEVCNQIHGQFNAPLIF